MNWSDLSMAWKGQNLPTAPVIDAAALQREFEAKRQRLAGSLFWRDLREAAAGLLVAGAFGYTAWQMGRAGWPIAFAVALIMGLTGFFLRERVRVRRGRVGAEAPLLTRLEAEISEMRRQRNLLLHVGTWYLAPCMAAAAIFGVTTMAQAPIPWWARLLAGAIMLVILAAVTWAVWALNRRAIRLAIEPRLAELEGLHEALQNLAE